jgi:hypothetical protein
MTLSDCRTILAIDPTTYGLAFVAFDRGEILDWGQPGGHRSSRETLRIVEDLFDRLAVDLLVLEDPDARHCKRAARIRLLLRKIDGCARKRGIATVRIAREDVRRFWRERGVTQKEAVAAAIASELPELSPFVPPRRTIWRSENPRVNLFDAASLALYACRTPHTP